MSATNRGSVRNPGDFYATPESAFLPMIPFIKKLPFTVWEPAQGDGRLVSWMISNGIEAIGSDIADGTDFLSSTMGVGSIVTNPPFSLAFEFCQHAVNLSRNVVMLLRLNFLASQKRKTWFTANPPTALFILSKRPSFTGGKTDACDYAWVAWSPRLSGIHFL